MARKLGMKQSVFNPNTRDPDDERFTGSIQDAILNDALSTSLGSLAAILVPCVWSPMR